MLHDHTDSRVGGVTDNFHNEQLHYTVCLRERLRRINCIFLFEFFQAPCHFGVVGDLHAKIQCPNSLSSMKYMTLKL